MWASLLFRRVSILRGSAVLPLALPLSVCVRLVLSLHLLWLCVAGGGDSAGLLAVDRGTATSFLRALCR